MLSHKQRDQLQAFLVAALIVAAIVGIASLCRGATVPEKSPEHSLVRVKLDAGEQAQVVRLDANRLRPVQSVAIDGGLVFTGPPGFYTVIVQPLQLLEAEIVEGGIAPPLPGPPPPAPPTPPSPSVPNRYGVGQRIYAAAVTVGDPAGVKVISEIFASAAGRLAGLQSADVVDDINAVNVTVRTEIDARVANVANWAAWRTEAKNALTAAWRAGHQTREAYVGVLDEIAKALAEVK